MNGKVTLRVPDPVLARLRERSRDEGRSLNEIAVQALLRGLGEHESINDWRVLDSLVEVSPSHHYDPEQMRRLVAGIDVDAPGLMRELDWVRDQE